MFHQKIRKFTGGIKTKTCLMKKYNIFNCVLINLIVCNLIVCSIESLKQKDKLRCRQWFKRGFQIKRERRECWRARAEKATGRRRKKRQNRRVLGSREGREDG